MEKRTMIAAIALLAASAGFAQEQPVLENEGNSTETVEYSTDKYKVETNKFWSNWFITAGGGVQLYFGDHDKQVDFGKRLSPAVDISVGKWFTPGIGVRFAYSGLWYKGATQNGIHSTGEEVPGKGGHGYWLDKQKFNYFSFRGDVMFNLTNLFCGYKEDRVYNCSPYVGVGMAKVTSNPKESSVAGYLGVYNSFRVSSAIDINLDVRAAMVSDMLDGEFSGSGSDGRGGEGALSATIGITYKFPKRGWDKAKTVTRTVYNTEELDAMRDRLKRMGEENNRLKDELSKRKPTETVINNIAYSSLIVFRIGSSELSNEARVNLGMFADAIKAGDKDAVYTITGYADAGTGSKKRNEQLSRERAEAVYECLVEEFGIDESQLNIDYKGGVENMFYDDPRMSRAVITKAK